MESDQNTKCLGCGCFTECSLKCPTCVKLGLTTSYFCSQDCFKTNWSTHQKLHRAVSKFKKQANQGRTFGYDSLVCGYKEQDRTTWKEDIDLCKFENFTFTGTLRPWPRTPMRGIPDHIPKPDYYVTGDPQSEVRSRYSTTIVVRTLEEITRIRKACHIGRRALDLAHTMIKPGITGDAIDEAVHHFILSMNAYPSPYNYCEFPKSCCISVNECICHGIPDLRPLQEGDIVNVDISVYHQGMHGDLNETFLCGQVDEEAKHLVRGAYECMMKAIAFCKPGRMYREIGEVISDVAQTYKLSIVRTYCGHGIGTLFHTAPNVPHYRRNKAVGIMKPGHVFTIEPMVNLGNFRDVTWPDDWTSTTIDGKRSAQFEHTLLVTETGVELLTARLPTSLPLEVEVPSEASYFNTEPTDE